MKSHNPRLDRLKELLSLEERRVGLQGELESITQRMTTLRDALFDEGADVMHAPSSSRKASAPVATPKKKGRGPQKRGRRGELKEQILGALHSAGSAGVRVKELAKVLGIKPVNIHSWFHSAKARFPQITKLQGGHYRLDRKADVQDSDGEAAAGNATQATKPGRRKSGSGLKPATGKKSGTRRGALSDKVLGELEKAGAKGVSVREIASSIGANYRNIYIWFATTGKKNAKIKKVGPAQYRLS